MIYLYNIILIILSPIILLYLVYRIFIGKENKKSFFNKIGFIKTKRPLGELIWFQAVSVGEAKSIFKIAKHYSNKYTVLITTSTLLSEETVSDNLPSNIIHQYSPVDISFIVKIFLKHWNPTIGIWVESEIWPNIIYHCRKNNISTGLIQGTLSEKSLKRWSMFKSTSRKIFSDFKPLIAQSQEDINKYKALGVNKKIELYNLKNNSSLPKINKKKRYELYNKIKNRSTLLACSTHKGEEEILIKNHIDLQYDIPNLLTIILPRHPSRALYIKKILHKNKLSFATRSEKILPDKNTNVYIADTFGEIGTIVSCSDIVILGGTFVPLGGHNIIELCKLSKSIICGPSIEKINDVMKLLLKNKAVIHLKNTEKLSTTLISLLKNYDSIKSMGSRAKITVETLAPAEPYIIKSIDKELFEKKNAYT